MKRLAIYRNQALLIKTRIFHAIILPVLLMFLAQHFTSRPIFVAGSTMLTSLPSPSPLFNPVKAGQPQQKKTPPVSSPSTGNELEEMLGAYLTQSIGHNLSIAIQSFLNTNPVPPSGDISSMLNNNQASNRQRRYVLRDPNDLNVILSGISSARNWTSLMQEVAKLASHFWYGEWCGAGWTKINESTTENLCCKCRNGVKTQFVDTSLIRNTANDCIKCGAHPIDPVDTGCMLHDICYTCTQSPFGALMANCECERIISYSAKAADCTRSVSRLYPQMNETMRYRWCTFYKGAIPLLFENKPCYCPRNGQGFVAFSLNMCDRGQYLIPVKG